MQTCVLGTEKIKQRLRVSSSFSDAALLGEKSPCLAFELFQFGEVYELS